MKGSGDFGEFGAGFFNGQIVNTLEGNNDFHYVARYTYPFQLRNGQFIETGIQGYTGKYKVSSLSSSTLAIPSHSDFNYDDRRIATSLIIYPQPFGASGGVQLGHWAGVQPCDEIHRSERTQRRIRVVELQADVSPQRSHLSVSSFPVL